MSLSLCSITSRFLTMSHQNLGQQRCLLSLKSSSTLEECSNVNLWARTACILSYHGSPFHMAVNYFLLAVSLSGCVWMQQKLPAAAGDENYEALPSVADGAAGSARPANDRRRRPTARAALSCLGFATAFQIVLCLHLHCSGISIVWCAAAGWMLYGGGGILRAQQPQHRAGLLLGDDRYRLVVPLCLDGLGILYYALTQEALTTIAHVCAMVLGAGLYWFSTRTSSSTTTNMRPTTLTRRGG